MATGELTFKTLKCGDIKIKIDGKQCGLIMFPNGAEMHDEWKIKFFVTNIGSYNALVLNADFNNAKHCKTFVKARIDEIIERYSIYYIEQLVYTTSVYAIIRMYANQLGYIMKTERAIDKIKKLLALSKSTNPNEAATALRQAQALMRKHDVTDEQISMSSIAEQRFLSKVSVSKIKPWEWNLVSSIADAFGCYVYVSSGTSYGKTKEEIYAKYNIVGLKSQLEIAVYTCEVILRKAMKAKAEFAKTVDMMLSRQGKTIEINGFLHGWTTEIMKTVHAFANPEEVETAITMYKSKRLGHLTSSKTQSRDLGCAGLSAGELAAKGESISRPVNGQGEIKRLS